MRDPDLQGIIAASLTPVTETFEVDAGRLSGHVARLIGQGCSFVSTFGTTGEGASFSVAQKLDALEKLVAAGIAPGKLMPGVMSPTVDEAAAMLAGLDRLGCRAVVMLPPFYYGASEEGIAAFYDAALARAGTAGPPIVLYNIPQLSRVTFTPSLIERLVKKHGSRIAGLKDSTGNRDNAVMLAKTFPDLAIFVGDDRVLPDLLDAGGAGLIGGLPNLFAPSSVAYYAAPRGDGAARLVEQTAERIRLVVEYGDLIALKGALAHYLGDPEWRRSMPPLMPLPTERVAAFAEAIAATGYAYEAAA